MGRVGIGNGGNEPLGSHCLIGWQRVPAGFTSWTPPPPAREGGLYRVQEDTVLVQEDILAVLGLDLQPAEHHYDSIAE